MSSISLFSSFVACGRTGDVSHGVIHALSRFIYAAGSDNESDRITRVARELLHCSETNAIRWCCDRGRERERCEVGLD